MPTLPVLGTGLSPLAQWIVIPIAAFRWVRPSPEVMGQSEQRDCKSFTAASVGARFERIRWMLSCSGPIALIAIPAIAGAGLVGVLLISADPGGGKRAPREVLVAGRVLYQQHCASCHGANLQGQPDWQTPLPTGRLPAPPHDASGHTWHHSDRVLFQIIKNGTAAVVGGDYESDMPRFGSVLSDDEIRAVLAFIKSTWPERERRYQEEMSHRETNY